MRCKTDGWLENDNCLKNCDCHLDPRNMQAGPIMVRHVIDGHEVLLPSDARLLTKDDPSDLGGCFAGGEFPMNRVGLGMNIGAGPEYICDRCGTPVTAEQGIEIIAAVKATDHKV